MRVIITYKIIQLSHIDIDDVEIIEQFKTLSLNAPNNIIKKYNTNDEISIEDLEQFNKIYDNPTLCKKLHVYNNKQLKCESFYYFAIFGKLVKPKYYYMKLYFDDIVAYHDGYCSDSECEYIINKNYKIKKVNIPEEKLGIYDNDCKNGEINVTDELREQYSYIDGNSDGSNYCKKPDTDDVRFKMITECCVNNYILTKIKLV